MVHLETEQKRVQEARERGLRRYFKVAQVKVNETEDDVAIRDIAGLVWKLDFLLETDAFIEECIYDGRILRKPKVVGPARSLNGGRRLGFDIPFPDPDMNFQGYSEDLHNQRKEIMQCPLCRIVYCRPIKIDVPSLRKHKVSKPYLIAQG
jgi:hypothetical protein